MSWPFTNQWIKLQAEQIFMFSFVIMVPETGNIDIIDLFLQRGVDIDILNYWNENALHIAITVRKKEAVRFLIERGANINIRECQDNTPLDYAIGKKDKEIIELLKSYGAKTGKQLDEEKDE